MGRSDLDELIVPLDRGRMKGPFALVVGLLLVGAIVVSNNTVVGVAMIVLSAPLFLLLRLRFGSNWELRAGQLGIQVRNTPPIGWADVANLQTLLGAGGSIIVMPRPEYWDQVDLGWYERLAVRINGASLRGRCYVANVGDDDRADAIVSRLRRIHKEQQPEAFEARPASELPDWELGG